MTRPHASTPRPRGLFARLLPALSACAVTVASLPLQAVTFPSVPLQSGAAYPPANVMFILDDSGSMEYVSMPHDVGVEDDLDNDLRDKYAGNNTIYYNPSTAYEPWIRADGTRYETGLDYDDAWGHPSLLSNGVDLSDEVRTWYWPKPGATDLDSYESFYRYQIREVDGDVRVVRSEALRRRRNNVGERGAGCDGPADGEWDWRACAFETPTGREEADELRNFATWYSYHRTRMKVAKAGASEAFAQLGENLRIGYDSIWNRSPYPIPVGSDDGLFRGGNRSTWFARLHAANGSGNTPLHGALQRAGIYFSDNSASGPWGPAQPAEQISCRQNFAILTTDGYWNSAWGYDDPVGDADGTAGPTVTDGAAKRFRYDPVKPYTDNFATRPRSRPDTLADVAMHYWKRDLVAALENNVPSDPAFWQHMVTFGVSIGLQGRLDPRVDEDTDDLAQVTNGSKHWGDPTDREDADRIDDLWHASVNGRGGFVTARNPDEFVEGLLAVLTSVAENLGSASNVATNSSSFVGQTRVFQATYTPGKWTGDLAAYGATSAGVAEDPDWRAAPLVSASGRKVLTWDGSGGTDFPTTAQLSALSRTGGLAPVTGADNAAYLEGDTSGEKRNGGKLRDRASLLGDIVNSSPVYVKETETIFVGANDGMLHAFDALTGAERFAYVPGGVDMAALASLSDPQYRQDHRYFVDGPLIVSTLGQTPGRNVLVGAPGRGGKGLFALEVGQPDAFEADDVLWERTGGSNMGQVLGEPLVVSLNDADRTTAVVVGNGLNSNSGHAVLFVLDIDTGAVLAEIDTGAGGDNGLFAPRGRDTDGNGTVDYVYAGDRLGHLWKFDLRAADADAWDVALGGQPLFTAASGQPLTGGLAIARNPVDGRRWVFFGTGSFMSADDLVDDTMQSIYGIVDDDATTVARSDLDERQIRIVTDQDGRRVRGFEPAAPLTAGRKGWFIDLDDPAAGERVISRPMLRGNALITSSIIPPTDATCDAGGRGFANAFDAFSGTSLPGPFFDVNGDGKVDGADNLPDGGVVGSVDLGVNMPTAATMIDKLLVAGGSKGTVGSILTKPPGGLPHRVRWREILKD